MGNFFNLYTLIAFIVGVLASGWVMSLLSRGRSTVSGG